ncbi:hypothetical protein [Limosilactobacillus reuteri]|uniref:hypothetical protein n=1 Tax=Limosilactobacillus reuteri TaxID=1598 RepID=UPI001E34CD2F|nr:hypothetical protein [Limosilactobacillus reuteri]MCC4466433.1 hypothetical protein [Limosilactobacillus reuteri]MCC4474209.1 hypothetical protein [Limosilactobacillus reuteri]
MIFHYYKGLKVEVTRVWEIAGSRFADLRDPRNGIKYEGVPLELVKDSPIHVAEQSKQPKGRLIRFEKYGNVFELYDDLDDYQEFIKKNQLNPKMIENCINGVTKTHKGFKISLVS